ncbi:MAG: WYL domain-containing protein [Clostridia bacterium]|nr:WYL domain-containing protein [Clostridia bacterium]
MIFSELYSAYYNTVAAIIARILDGEHSERELQSIVTERAFGESALTILPSLKSEKWQLVHADMTTALTHRPTMPLTTLQKQWLKAISLDPRIKLFGVSLTGLDGVDPLFTPEDYYVYDQYSDGDPFEDEEYIRQFRVILTAIKRHSQIKFEMVNRKGNTMFVRCRPVRLEYSEKDDKFRVVTAGWRSVATVNLAKIQRCTHYLGEKILVGEERETQYDTATLRVVDERNALERVMLHFAHFEKQAERLDENTYLLQIKYAHDDEPELVIRVLSFGPMVEVLESASLRRAVCDKLIAQRKRALR